MKPKHKSPGKRLLSLLFCLLLTLQMVPGTADAVLSGVYFVAVNYDLMDLNQETMPFWSDGQLYVSHAAFSGSYGSSLGVSCSVNSARRVTVLYTLQNALFFDTGAGSTYDNQGNTYTELAIEKNGYVFLPIRLVTSFFGLTYSYRQTETIPLIRIKTRTSVLSDDVFIDAAATLMRSRYKEYEESLTAAATPPTVNTDPDDPAPTVYEGQRVYLVFRFTDRSSTLSLLSSLNRYQKQATFLMTPQQMEENHDLLRHRPHRYHPDRPAAGAGKSDPAGRHPHPYPPGLAGRETIRPVRGHRRRLLPRLLRHRLQPPEYDQLLPGGKPIRPPLPPLPPGPDGMAGGRQRQHRRPGPAAQPAAEHQMPGHCLPGNPLNRDRIYRLFNKSPGSWI